MKRKTLLLTKIVTCVLILHNMNVEDRLYEDVTPDDEDELQLDGQEVLEHLRTSAQVIYEENAHQGPTLRDDSRRKRDIQDKDENARLMKALRNHIYENFGPNHSN